MVRRIAILVAVLSLAGFGTISPASAAEVAYTPAPAVGPTPVCMVGDSITARGTFWRHTMALTRGNDWHYVGNYYDGAYLHDGVGGNSTTDILARLTTIQGCGVVLLLAGGNDLRNYRSPASIVTNLQRIADTLKATGAVVYVQTLLPVRLKNYSVEANLAIAYTNSLIKSTLVGHPIIDTWAAMTSAPYGDEYLFVDGIHPSWLGYLVLGNYVAPRVQ